MLQFPAMATQSMRHPAHRAVLPLATLALLGPFASPVHSQPAPSGPPAGTVRFQNGTDALNIPIELNNNHVYVPVRIGGTTLSVVLDTGGGSSAFDPDLARAAGLAFGDSVTAAGAGGSTSTAWLLHDVTYDVPGVTLSGQTVAAVSFRALEPATGHRMDGVLGHDFLRHFIVEIDYFDKLLHLHDPATWSYAGRGDTLALDLSGPIPMVHATLNDSIPLRLLVDTGARHAVMLSRSFVQAHGLGAAARKTLKGPPGLGIGGATEQTIGRFDRLQIGRFKLLEPLVGLSEDRGGVFAHGEHDGVLGGEVWRRFRVILDYPHNRMFLEPNLDYAGPFDADMSGLALRVGEEGRYEVMSVTAGSPADSAGIKPGDVLDTMNGHPATDLSLDALRAAFRAPGQVVLLELKRKSRTLKVRLTLRRLV